MENLQMVQLLILLRRSHAIANLGKREETVPQIGKILSLGLVSMQLPRLSL